MFKSACSNMMAPNLGLYRTACRCLWQCESIPLAGADSCPVEKHRSQYTHLMSLVLFRRMFSSPITVSTFSTISQASQALPIAAASTPAQAQKVSATGRTCRPRRTAVAHHTVVSRSTCLGSLLHRQVTVRSVQEFFIIIFRQLASG